MSIDILALDAKIQSFFTEQVNSLPTHRERLKELEETQKKGVVPALQKDLEYNITELRNLITEIESGRNYNFYIADTVELLNKYRNILKTPLKMSFTGKKTETNKEKNEIVQKYLDIVKKYYPIETQTNEKKFRMECDNCPNTEEFIVRDNAYICSDCGSQQEIIQQATSYKDADRVNISSKYTYDRKVHFRDCINQYQGKQNCTIDAKIYTDLENAFERHHLLVGDKNTPKEKRFSQITKSHILMFLKELDYSKQYENVNLIHYNMTGKKPDDISHLEDRLLADFDLLTETYDKYIKPDVDRVSFISSQYVLYQLLQRYKHPCKKEDFVILKTVDRKTFHNDIMSKASLILGWSFTPI